MSQDEMIYNPLNDFDFVFEKPTALSVRDLLSAFFIEAESGCPVDVCTFEEAGVLTSNRGLVLTIGGRTGNREFQITIVDSTR